MVQTYLLLDVITFIKNIDTSCILVEPVELYSYIMGRPDTTSTTIIITLLFSSFFFVITLTCIHK